MVCETPSFDNFSLDHLVDSYLPDSLKSTLHRVTLPPLQDRFTGTERMTRDRYSIPYFLSPDSQSIVECLPACTDAEHPVKYPPLVQNDYRRMRAMVQYPKNVAKASA